MSTQGKQTTIVSNLPAGNSIIKNEGVQNKAYTDTRGNTTIGIGYKLSGTNKEQATKDLTAVGADPAKVMAGEAELTDNQVKNLFNISHIRATTGAKQVVKNYATLPKPAQEALVELTFNLGKAGLSDFKETIKLIEQNKLKEASKELLDSKWAKQVGIDRATEIANKFLTSEPSSTITTPKSPLVMAAKEDVKLPKIGSDLSLNMPKQPAVAPAPIVPKPAITRPVVTKPVIPVTTPVKPVAASIINTPIIKKETLTVPSINFTVPKIPGNRQQAEDILAAKKLKERNNTQFQKKEIVEPSRLQELATSLKKEGITNTVSQVWNKLTSPDNIEAQKVVIKKEVPLTKQEKKIVDKESIVALGDTLHNYDGDPNRYLVPFRANMENLKVGVRNRKEEVNLNTSNALFSTYKSFEHPNNVQEYDFDKFIKVNTKTGKLDVIDRMDFNKYKEADKNDVVITGTYAHKIKTISRNTKFYNPGIETTTLGYKTPDNKSKHVKVFGDNLSNNLGGYQGGKLLITTPDNKNPKVIYGPANVIAEQIERYKKQYNVDYVWALEADGKAYAQSIQNKNKKITKEQLLTLDNKNSADAGSGNIIYIKE